jgi:hypothetical protein
MLHKQTCLEICQQLLYRYGNECDAFLESSLVMKHGFIIVSQRVNGRVWGGNIHNRPERKSSKANHLQEN